RTIDGQRHAVEKTYSRQVVLVDGFAIDVPDQPQIIKFVLAPQQVKALDDKRRVRQVGELFAVRLILTDALAAREHFYFVAVAKHHQRVDAPAADIAHRPVGGGVQHRTHRRVDLALVKIGGELGQTEDVHHAVIA